MLIEISRVLERTDEGYAQFVAEFVDGLDPATRAHLAVAYQNLIPTLSGMASAYKNRDIEFTVEIFISQLERDMSAVTDEINSRRLTWFLIAALLARLEKIAKRSARITDLGATIWTIVLTEYPRLKVVLPRNIVWSSQEKEWFDIDEPDKVLIERGMNYHVPFIFSNTEIMEDFARSMDISHHPMEGRIGYVP